MPELNDRVVVSRRIIYTQIGLLAVLPATCFILGWMMGHLTAPPKESDNSRKFATASGVVLRPEGDKTVVDAGATVLLIPVNTEFSQRWDPSSIHPTSFQPLNNPLIAAIQDAGGGVVRTIDDGSFRLQIGGPGQYWLIVISTAPTQQKLELNRVETAALSRLFLPLEDLFEQRKFLMTSVQVTGDRKDLGQLSINRSN